MTRHPRSVDQAIARFEEVMGRIDRSGVARDAQRRLQSRRVADMRKKLGNIGMAIGVLIAATIVFGLISADRHHRPVRRRRPDVPGRPVLLGLAGRASGRRI